MHPMHMVLLDLEVYIHAHICIPLYIYTFMYRKCLRTHCYTPIGGEASGVPRCTSRSGACLWRTCIWRRWISRYLYTSKYIYVFGLRSYICMYMYMYYKYIYIYIYIYISQLQLQLAR